MLRLESNYSVSEQVINLKNRRYAGDGHTALESTTYNVHRGFTGLICIFKYSTFNKFDLTCYDLDDYKLTT